MPGFLGTERQFAARYSKPILASRDARSSGREQEAGKKQVLLLNEALLFLGKVNPAVGETPEESCSCLVALLIHMLFLWWAFAGVLAMEALHRQVLPFLLRRMKEDVLQDLPPKIIQDYYCILSPLQASSLRWFAFR